MSVFSTEEEEEEEATEEEDPTGVADLARALLKYRNGRDVFIVGSANIGKSTLTNRLVKELLHRQDFLDKMDKRRRDTLLQSAPTMSPLPGTTLQNILIPCFSDHTQALWDTPGLVISSSRYSFPVPDLQAITQSRPSRLQQRLFEVDVPTTKGGKTLQLLIGSEDIPVARFQIKLGASKTPQDGRGEEGGAGGGGDKYSNNPTAKLIWQSLIRVPAKEIQESGHYTLPTWEPDPLTPEEMEEKEVEEEYHAQRRKERDAEREQRGGVPLTAKEKEIRQTAYTIQYKAFEKSRQEVLGAEEHARRKQMKIQRAEKAARMGKLERLSKVAEYRIRKQEGFDINVYELGTLTFWAPTNAIVSVFLPNLGVAVSCHPSLFLPPPLVASPCPAPASPAPTATTDEDNDLGVVDEAALDAMFDDDDFEDLVFDGDELDGGVSSSSSSSGLGNYRSKLLNKWDQVSGEMIGWRYNDNPGWERWERIE
mmetsp:Transcript_19957/g.39546  ORF Transcript_19957/g.39546 Transcript_19957/m.39546 type:complete len:481 (-) Transcript_19957:84-1526(-)